MKNKGLIVMKGPFYVVVIMPDGKEVTVVCKKGEPARLVCDSIGQTEVKIVLVNMSVIFPQCSCLIWLKLFL